MRKQHIQRLDELVEGARDFKREEGDQFASDQKLQRASTELLAYIYYLYVLINSRKEV